VQFDRLLFQPIYFSLNQRLLQNTFTYTIVTGSYEFDPGIWLQVQRLDVDSSNAVRRRVAASSGPSSPHSHPVPAYGLEYRGDHMENNYSEAVSRTWWCATLDLDCSSHSSRNS